MRLKNVKNAKEIIQNSPYVVLEPKTYKGNWSNLFKNNNNINIEIGMGKGDFIISIAKKFPNTNFIGIEMFDSVLVRATQKLEKEEIPNLKLIRMDASNIEEVFDKEVDTIYLNFSDPWPKKRHSKRRLTSHFFLEKYDHIFKDDCHIIQKTDNIYLFSFSIQSLSTYGYILNSVTMDLESECDIGNVYTEYEKKFINKGIKICRLDCYKK